MKTGGVYLGFHTFRGRKFPHGNFRTSVFCEVKIQIVGKKKFFDSLNSFFHSLSISLSFSMARFSMRETCTCDTPTMRLTCCCVKSRE